MKKIMLLLLTLVAMTVAATQASPAGSAVAMEPRHANLTTAEGREKKARALNKARRLYYGSEGAVRYGRIGSGSDPFSAKPGPTPQSLS